MVAGSNVNGNTKGWPHQAATLSMMTAPATKPGHQDNEAMTMKNV